MRTRSQKRVYMHDVAQQLRQQEVAASGASQSPQKKRKMIHDTADITATPLLLTPHHKPRALPYHVDKTPKKAAVARTKNSVAKRNGLRRTLQYSSTFPADSSLSEPNDAQSVLERISAGQTTRLPLIVGRAVELQAVRAVLEGDKQQEGTATNGSLFIIGPPGTGKSSSVDQLLAEQAYELHNLVTSSRKCGKKKSDKVAVKLNCSTFTDPAALYVEIAQQLRRATSWKLPVDLDPYALDEFLSKQGSGRSKSTRHSVVIVLDEVDQLLRLPTRAQPNVTEVLRFLVRWAAVTSGSAKFLGIMNGVDMYQQLARVHVSGDEADGSQVPRVIYGSYTHEDLLSILHSHVQSARRGCTSDKDQEVTVIEPRAMELIARKVAARDGDARRAISLLQQCARHALRRSGFGQSSSPATSPDSTPSEPASSPATPLKVTLRDVFQSANAMLTSSVVQQITQLPRQPKLLLYVMTSLAPSNSSPSPTKRAPLRCDMNAVSEELARLRNAPQTAWVPRFSREELQTHLTTLDCYALVKRGGGTGSNEKAARSATPTSMRAFWTAKLSSCVTMAEVSRALESDSTLTQLLM
ncbi:hypothetical protein BBJ28_00000339 [Nothophytophthora sp. Chile5]|nr:hypothetical protein BBJ28_00000339 [Nothophytophthora sp. Chile5]